MFSSQMFSFLVVDLDAFLNGAKELGRLDMYHATRPKGIPQGGGTLRVCQRKQQSDEHPSHRKRFAYGKSAIHFSVAVSKVLIRRDAVLTNCFNSRKARP